MRALPLHCKPAATVPIPRVFPFSRDHGQFCSQWGNPAQERAPTSSEIRLVWSWGRSFRKPNILSVIQGRRADEEELFHDMSTYLQPRKSVAGDNTNTTLIRNVMPISRRFLDVWLSWWLIPAVTAPWQATGTQVTSGTGDPHSPLIYHTSNNPAAGVSECWYFNWRWLYQQQRTSSP